MDNGVDHTHEVEKRVTAIHIKAMDSCSFFEHRKSALIPTKECWYCVYGKFDGDKNYLNPEGLCKFKGIGELMKKDENKHSQTSWIKLVQDSGLEQQFILAAREHGVELTEEAAKIFYEKTRMGGELSEDELDNVAGGCGKPQESLEERKKRAFQQNWAVLKQGDCPFCYSKGSIKMGSEPAYPGFVSYCACKSCKIKVYENGRETTYFGN